MALAAHPGFAFRFFRDPDGALWQQYAPALIPRAEIEDISPEREATLAETLITPFSELIGRGLCRVALYRGERGLYFFMDVHHLLADGLSEWPFFESLTGAYSGREPEKDCYSELMAMEERSVSTRYEADKAYLLACIKRYARCWRTLCLGETFI